MNDTQFEQQSRAHSFWQEWQDAADRAGDPGTYDEVDYTDMTPQQMADVVSDKLIIEFRKELDKIRQL